MANNKAIFKYNNGNSALLCSKCRKIIKSGKDFDEIDKLALKGVVTLEPQYCDEHKYLGMHGYDKHKEMVKQGIKEQLREGIMKKNMIGLVITRPDQKLIIMRGIPGSGKSTKAKSLVGEGIIHSTDTLIEATGDYEGYFKKMIDSGNWSEHGKMHHNNFINAKESMIEGVSPVIIDNTGLRLKEVENYIIEGLKLGLDETNIKVVDIGNAGLTAEVLAKRNTHNVPLKKIEKMMQTHKSVGKITVTRVVENYLKNKKS